MYILLLFLFLSFSIFLSCFVCVLSPANYRQQEFLPISFFGFAYNFDIHMSKFKLTLSVPPYWRVKKTTEVGSSKQYRLIESDVNGMYSLRLISTGMSRKMV